MIRQIEMDLQFSPTIPGPPVRPEQLHKQACSSDDITVSTWKKQWIAQFKENHKRFGPFSNTGIGQLFGKMKHRPCVVAGSGPSLKVNAEKLKNLNGIGLVSCLHNYHYFEELGITPDYYVNLDAGQVTVEEVSEGGSRSAEEYFDSTKGKTLLAATFSHPDLISRWQGKILWFQTPLSDVAMKDEFDAIEPFYTYVSTGGNVMGSAFYIAKAILGANPIIFVGADFSFSYDHKFHAWESKYDVNMGSVLFATDVFGNRVKTWQSYYLFKCWFESRVCMVPGIYINATEGGIFGSYPEGNIAQIRQMSLGDVIRMYSLCEDQRAQCENPQIHEAKVLF